MRLRKMKASKNEVKKIKENIEEMKNKLEEIFDHSEFVFNSVDEEDGHSYSVNLQSILGGITGIKEILDKIEE